MNSCVMPLQILLYPTYTKNLRLQVNIFGTFFRNIANIGLRIIIIVSWITNNDDAKQIEGFVKQMV